MTCNSWHGEKTDLSWKLKEIFLERSGYLLVRGEAIYLLERRGVLLVRGERRFTCWRREEIYLLEERGDLLVREVRGFTC